jgi:hypothetical protein
MSGAAEEVATGAEVGKRSWGIGIKKRPSMVAHAFNLRI